jgi:acetylornithine deacetylase/succinyl-diaminopimelate desuccinylase-like protein
MKHLVEQINRAIDWHWLPELTQWVIEQAIAIQQIPAPTFAEARRAAYVAQQFTLLKLTQIETDEVQNIYGLRRGRKNGAPAIMVTAHTDTVFPAETDLKFRREGNIIYGPGLGDNSLGVAALLGLARLLHDQSIEHDGDIWFVATVGEEGLGDLCGMKAAFTRLQHRIQSVINLEGLAFEHVYHGGIAVRRLHITANAEGGHSWLNFGNSSAIHGIVQLGARITTLSPPTAPRTTYNIGIIEGGQTINTIAAQAGLWLDLRSEVQSALMQLEEQVLAEIKALTTTQLTFTKEIVGDRPAGWLSPEHPLVQGAMAALAQLGIQGTLETGSTDANIPLAAGCPAVTIGITRGGNAHRLDEYIDTQPVAAGLKQLILLTLAATRQENL